MDSTTEYRQDSSSSGPMASSHNRESLSAYQGQGASNVFADLRAFIDATGKSRQCLKTFISTYTEVIDILSDAHRRVGKLSESLESAPAHALCQLISGYINCILSVSQVSSIDEMKDLKTVVKDRCALHEAELKRKFKEFQVLKQSIDRLEQVFIKTQSDLRAAHSKSVYCTEPPRRGGFGWSPLRGEDKEKLFERIQKLMNEQKRTATETELEFSQLTAMHLAMYNRAGVVVSELASMRRRVNRRIMSELQGIIPKLESEIARFSSQFGPVVLDRLAPSCPTSGDFSMRISPLDASLAALVGGDRHQRIGGMSAVPDAGLLEYRAVQSYMAKEEGELSFNRNARIEVITKDPSGWWLGRNEQGQSGVFPSVLVVPRPAGAPLPLQQAPAVSYRPRLHQRGDIGTWNSTPSADDIGVVIANSPAFAYIGVVQFAYKSNGLCVDSGDVVEIERVADAKHLVVKTDSGNKGIVPIKILSIKPKHDQENNGDWSNFEMYYVCRVVGVLYEV